MWLTFWLNNSHFALEFFGAVISFALAWLAFDAFLVKRDFKTLSRSLGFSLFAFWLVVHSLNLTADLILILASASYLSGLFFLLLNLYLEKPPARPKLEIVFILPAVSGVLWIVHIGAAIFLVFIALLAVKRYKEELQKTLRPFFIAFSLLALASVLAIFSPKIGGSLWFVEHFIKIIGFGFLGYWGWQYLKLRIKEEMLLVFIGMALFISVIVTFTFSAVLLKNMEGEAKINLVSNVKVLDFTFSRMKNEALSNAQLFAKNEELRDDLENKDFVKLEKISRQLMVEKSMDFLTIADEEGEVILRAHSLAAKGDNIRDEKAGEQALGGKSYAEIEENQAEKFSIRGAGPIYDFKNNIIGVIITGFIIDNAFSDQIKKSTGLEMTVYKEDMVQATTIFDPDGKTRNVGAKQTDFKVIKQVLEEGQGITINTMIFSRPYLAAYLPLKNSEGKVIGMFQASRLQTEIIETAAAANRLTLLVTIIIVIMMLMPAYWLAKKLTEEV